MYVLYNVSLSITFTISREHKAINIATYLLNVIMTLITHILFWDQHVNRIDNYTEIRVYVYKCWLFLICIMFMYDQCNRLFLLSSQYHFRSYSY